MDAVDTRTDAERIRALIETYEYEGFGDLDHLLTVPTRSRQRLHSKLASLDAVEGVPFPASMAIVRAIILDSMAREDDREPSLADQPGNLRFGVYRQHMPCVKEVTYRQLQDGFHRIRFHRDVGGEQIGARVGSPDHRNPTLNDWRGFEFYSIPAMTSDSLWDLYDMSETDWANPDWPRREIDYYDSQGTKVEAYSPILVAYTRNQDRLKEFRALKRRIPAIPMSQHGSCLHLTLIRIPRLMPEHSHLLQDLINQNFPILGDSSVRHRPYIPGESWLVATYEPPPNIRAIPGRELPGFIGLAETPRDPWTLSLAQEQLDFESANLKSTEE